MKLQHILPLAILTVLVFSTCKKDSLNETGKVMPNDGHSHTSLLNSDSSCIDQIEEQYVRVTQREIAKGIYEQAVSWNESLSSYGEPVWEGTVTKYDTASEESLNIVPMVDQEADSVQSLFVIELQDSSFFYFFIEKQRFLETPNTNIEIQHDGVTTTFNSNFIIDMFNACECYLYCNDDFFRNHHRVICPGYGGGNSFWDTIRDILGWIRDIFTGLGGDDDLGGSGFSGGGSGTFTYDGGSGGGGNGGGGGSGNLFSDADIVNNYEHLICQWYQLYSNGEVTVNQLPGGEFNQEQADYCSVIDILDNHLDEADLADLINNPEIFDNGLANFVLQDPSLDETDLDAISFYIQMCVNEGTTLPWKGFFLGYQAIVELVLELQLTPSQNYIDKATNFATEHSWSDEVLDYIYFGLELIKDEPDIKWERLEELYNLVKDNPDFFVDCTGNPSSYYPEFWTNLASFVPPPVVMEKIESLPGDPGEWGVQEIQNANGARVNLDYFSIEITTLPVVNGNQLSANELLSHIRKNINDFVNPIFGEFYPYNQSEAALWQSNVPLTAVISVVIPGDDGSVITSFHEECCWTFTTLKAPFFFHDGTHPVTGNRQFGYRINENDNIEIYTKGADRMSKWHLNLLDELGFAGADELWQSFRTKVHDFVNNNGGEANLQTPTTRWRPDWEDVREKLMSNFPISTIACE